MSHKQIQIIDTTIPKGGFHINHSFIPEQVEDIAQGLERSKIQIMEISHGCGVGSYKRGMGGLHSEKVYLKSLRKLSLNLNYSLLFYPNDPSALEIEALKDLFQIGRLALYFSEIPNSEIYFKQLKDFKKTPMAILKGISQLSSQQLVDAAAKFKEWGAEVLFLEDTFGDLNEANFDSILNKSQINKIIPIGFSANQNLGLGLNLALCAVNNGAEWVDGSLLGFGNGGGSLPLENLVYLLKNIGACNEIDLVELTRTAKNYAFPAVRSLPYPRAVDYLCAKYQIDFNSSALLNHISELLEVQLDTLLQELKSKIPPMKSLDQEIVQNYLMNHKLDLGVVKQYFTTGKIS